MDAIYITYLGAIAWTIKWRWTIRPLCLSKGQSSLTFLAIVYVELSEIENGKPADGCQRNRCYAVGYSKKARSLNGELVERSRGNVQLFSTRELSLEGCYAASFVEIPRS